MDYTDSLLTLTEIALGIAGFSAIVIVLAGGRASQSRGLIYQVRSMVVSSLGITCLGLFPSVLSSAALPDDEVWRYSSCIHVFGVLFLILPLYVIEQRSVTRQAPDSGFSRLLIVLWSLATVALAVQLSNLVGWPFAPSFSAFYLGLWLGLLTVVLQFIFMVYRLFR